MSRSNKELVEVYEELKSLVHKVEKMLARSGKDFVGGFEYCFTLSHDGAPITNEEDLPDPNWPFDQLAFGRTRGAHVYYDGEPTPTNWLPYVISFKRPMPDKGQRKADMDPVVWEQEPAYKP